MVLVMLDVAQIVVTRGGAQTQQIITLDPFQRGQAFDGRQHVVTGMLDRVIIRGGRKFLLQHLEGVLLGALEIRLIHTPCLFAVLSETQHRVYTKNTKLACWQRQTPTGDSAGGGPFWD